MLFLHASMKSGSWNQDLQGWNGIYKIHLGLYDGGKIRNLFAGYIYIESNSFKLNRDSLG